MKVKLLVLVGSFLVAVSGAHAQAGAVKVRVPFAFEAVNTNLPAGEYVIWSEHERVLLRTASGKMLAMMQSNRTIHEGGQSGRVVFQCYQKRCFLSQLLLPDAERGREILMSKTEKQLAQQVEPQSFVLLGESPEQRSGK